MSIASRNTHILCIVHKQTIICEKTVKETIRFLFIQPLNRPAISINNNKSFEMILKGKKAATKKKKKK